MPYASGNCLVRAFENALMMCLEWVATRVVDICVLGSTRDNRNLIAIFERALNIDIRFYSSKFEVGLTEVTSCLPQKA